MLESTRETCFTIPIAKAHSTAVPITSRVPVSIGTAPGRMMINAPTNPTTKAEIRPKRMSSLKNKMATTAPNSGAVKVRAENLASGNKAIALKDINMATELRTARVTCRLKPRVSKITKPDRNKIGTNTMRPKKFLKNTSWNGWTVEDR